MATTISGGICIFPGLVTGQIFVLDEGADCRDNGLAADFEQEWADFCEARLEALKQIAEMSDFVGVFNAQAQLVDDPIFAETVRTLILSGFSAVTAVRQAASQFPHLIDLGDIARRLMAILTGTWPKIALNQPSIVIAGELYPSQMLEFDKNFLLGIALKGGAEYSHTAVLARILGVPCIFQANIDGPVFNGRIATLNAKKLQQNIKIDKKIKFYANITSVADLPAVIASKADGIGLMRTEFQFARTAPTEKILFDEYRQIAVAMDGRRVVIRAPWRDFDHRPDDLITWLKAVDKAQKYGSVAVLLPLVSSVWEIENWKKLAQKAGMAKISIGIMIETPAAALIADELAGHADFFSVGTNDLVQYTLAADRQNPRHAKFYDPAHPAVNFLLKNIIQAAKKQGISAMLCGEVAADGDMLSILVEMGFEEFSVAPARIASLFALQSGWSGANPLAMTNPMA